MSEIIEVKRLEHGNELPLPNRMTEASSGCDVCAAIETEIIIQPGERVLVPTGYSFAIPVGYEVQVRPRSGLAYKHGITVLNAPGTIDADYRGEVKVLLVNLGTEAFGIKRGDRIAQLVPAKVAATMRFVEKNEISESQRGEGGFGHTGV